MAVGAVALAEAFFSLFLIVLDKLDEQRVKTGMLSNMLVFMAETMAGVQSLRDSAGRVHGFLRVAGELA